MLIILEISFYNFQNSIARQPRVPAQEGERLTSWTEDTMPFATTYFLTSMSVPPMKDEASVQQLLFHLVAESYIYTHLEEPQSCTCSMS